jgi:hypothetical protein
MSARTMTAPVVAWDEERTRQNEVVELDLVSGVERILGLFGPHSKAANTFAPAVWGDLAREIDARLLFPNRVYGADHA